MQKFWNDIKIGLFQQTPLHIAVREGYKHTVDCLVTKGANINIKDNDAVSEAIILERAYKPSLVIL